MLPANRTARAGIIPSVFLDEWPFDHLFKQMNGGTSGSPLTDCFGTDLVEYSNRYVVTLDVPGVDRNDIELSMEKNTLTIKMKREPFAEDSEVRYHHRSRWHGETTRTLTLPEAASSEDIEATLKNGVLQIEIKKQPEKQPRKIDIKTPV